jgi:hypothetical protein
MGMVYWELQWMDGGGLWKRSIPLYGISVRETWRKGMFKNAVLHITFYAKCSQASYFKRNTNKI